MESVRCEFKYSRAAVLLVLAAAGATFVMLVVTPWDSALRIALGVHVVAQSLRALHALAAVRSASIDLDGTIVVQARDGAMVTGTLRPGCFVAPWLVCVRWRAAGARFDSSIVVLPGMLGREVARKLRILLREA